MTNHFRINYITHAGSNCQYEYVPIEIVEPTKEEMLDLIEQAYILAKTVMMNTRTYPVNKDVMEVFRKLTEQVDNSFITSEGIRFNQKPKYHIKTRKELIEYREGLKRLGYPEDMITQTFKHLND